MHTDVVVIGAGIVGCAVARSVARDGHSVVVLDPDPPGQRASWAAAGMLAPQAESDSADALFPLLLEARDRYPAFVREIEAETGIDVGYSDAGMMFVALNDAADDRLIERFRWQSEMGLPIERLGADEVQTLEPAVTAEVIGGLRFQGDHAVDNRLLTRALYSSAEAAGARFRSEGVGSLSLNGGNVRLHTFEGEKIEAGRIVIAAGSWSGGVEGLPRRLPVEPVHGELMSYFAPGLLRHTIGVEGGYLVPRTDGRIIAGTTVSRIGFSSEATQAGAAVVKSLAERIIPQLASVPVTDHWAGLRPGTPDGFPILGQDPEFPALLYATGHYRNGILLAPITGEIIADLIARRAPTVDISDFRAERFEA